MLLWVGCPSIFNWIINNSSTQQAPSSHFLSIYSKINQGVTMLKARQSFMSPLSFSTKWVSGYTSLKRLPGSIYCDHNIESGRTVLTFAWTLKADFKEFVRLNFFFEGTSSSSSIGWMAPEGLYLYSAFQFAKVNLIKLHIPYGCT